MGRETVQVVALPSVAARLRQADGLSGVLSAVLDAAACAFGPVGGMLGLLEASGRTVTIAALQDTPPSFSCGNRSLPLAACLPIAEAARGGTAVWVSGPRERMQRYPELAARTPEPYACGSLPFVAGDRVTGVLCLPDA
jgi:GAF domain-containing protein